MPRVLHMEVSDLLTYREVKMIIKKIESNWSAGPDNIDGELLKVDEPKVITVLHDLIIEAWTTQKMPIDW